MPRTIADICSRVSSPRMLCPTGKLVDVTLEMFGAYMVVNTRDSPFQRRPETLDAVRVDLTTNVFAGTVLDRLVGVEVPQALVRLMVVGIDRFAMLDAFMDEPGQRFTRFPT